jgi:hypothetical protein
MTWKPDIVLYHGGCNDGFGAAWACWKKWGGGHDPADSPVYVPMRYGDKLPGLCGANVLFVDFSLKRDAMIEAAAEAKSIVVLDHHKTAWTELGEFTSLERGEHADNMRFDSGVLVNFDMEKSGARLAWEFCFPDEPIPYGLELIEDRDLWTFKYEETKAFTQVLSSYEQDFKVWSDALNFVDDTIGIGNALLRDHEKEVRECLANAHQVNIAGHKVLAVNVPYFLGSDCANELLKRDPGRPFSAYYFKRGDGNVQWGLRSRKDFDCSEIAKRFGGGGHAQASGFTVPGV